MIDEGIMFMGGTKRRPLASVEKAQQQQKDEKPKKGQEHETKSKSDLYLSISGNDLLKALGGVKAITAYSASKSLGVKVNVARDALENLREKGSLERVGGYSGHYVYHIKSSAS
ncbi:MAG: hypothetical protein JRN19_04700 [Nitrososphaerota archaeon]|nr:hypothetical protein [Nitrososphaerota archaeon]MDG7049525.1 hypothetical protein [Nitrososphaerota archaeon]MDG7051731.1 hypothetical protein [Nitrososphaerota archaeon]